jgi:nitrogen fixation/metabolism regulation signal transduction histidine kinase
MRRNFYTDPELQFPLIVSLIGLVTIQSLFVGWGFYRMIAIARQWDRPDQAWAFFATLAFTIVPVVLVNFALGTYLSHKIAGPLSKIRLAAGEIARGNLEVDVRVREGDLIQSYAVDFNTMIQTLRRLIYRDRDHAQEADKLLTDMLEWLASEKELGEAGKTQAIKFVNGAKSRLSVINTHFMKGRDRKEAP